MNKHLEKLIDNAFDFLEMSIEQFETEPKYSIIHFCSAIELFLKARLMQEHWTLIVDDKEPCKKKFELGNFKSINFKDILPKIEKVTGENISQDIKKSFNELANHRNQVVHFYKEFYEESEEEIIVIEENYDSFKVFELLRDNIEKSTKIKPVKKEIIIEQYVGWCHLKGLLLKWTNCFSGYNQRIDFINEKMVKYEPYLADIYKKIKPSLIEQAGEENFVLKKCSLCNFCTSVQYRITESIFKYKCKLCDFEEVGGLSIYHVYFEDTQCKGEFSVLSNDIDDIDSFIECSECEKKIKLNDFWNNISKDYIRDDVACSHCGCESCVIKYDDIYICKKCLSYSEAYQDCEYCSIFQIGEGNFLEDSYQLGCNFCDGYIGYIVDKDD